MYDNYHHPSELLAEHVVFCYKRFQLDGNEFEDCITQCDWACFLAVSLVGLAPVRY